MLSIGDLEANQPPPSDPADNLVKHGRYYIPDPDTGVMRRWTRASQFGKIITDNYMLGRWKERQVAKGLAMRPDLLEKIRNTEDKTEINDLCQKAKEAAGSKKGANIGTFIHSVTEAIDRGEFPKIRDDVYHDVSAYRTEMRSHNFYAIPEYIERVIICPPVNCAGRYDRVIRVVGNGITFEHPTEGKVSLPAGTLLIGDVKTAQNIGYSWLEVSIQLALYANASKIYNPGTGTFESMPDVSKKWAIVMSVPAGSKRCDMYWIDIEAGWELALLALNVRTSRNRKALAGRFTQPNPFLATSSVRGLDWRARIDEAKTKSELSMIWQEASGLGEWTEELEAYGLNRKEELRG